MADTALLMIDMQNSYLADDGVRDALGWPPIWRLDETIAACADLLAAARDLGMPVIYSRGMDGALTERMASPRPAPPARSACGAAGRDPTCAAGVEPPDHRRRRSAAR